MVREKKKKKKVRPTGRLKEFWISDRGRKLRGSVYILLALFLAVAMVSLFFSSPHAAPDENWLGTVGYHLSSFLVRTTFGFASIGFTLLLFVYGLRLWNVNLLPWNKTLWSTLFWMVWLSALVGYIANLLHSDRVDDFAGVTGGFVAIQLNGLIRWGTLVVLLFVAVVYLIFVHKVRFRFPKIKLPHRKRTPRPQPLKPDDSELSETSEFSETSETSEFSETSDPSDESSPAAPITFTITDDYHKSADQPTDPAFTITDNQPDIPSDLSEDDGHAEGPASRKHFGVDDLYDPHLELSQYVMPNTGLLSDWEVRNVKVTTDELVANKDRIVETLRNYGIEIVEISAAPGPTVTLYEIKPAPGVRISKIKGLEDDIALSLSALGIRIIAPIPGKGTVGIEVPNAKPQIVSMKTMLECDAFANNTKMELPIAFGKTISNEPFITDLAKMPHLLMAGATGTGKSVGLNAVISSLLYKKHPSELKFVMVDPKKVELSLYNKIERHYLAMLPDSEEAIITDVKKVVRTLNSLCIEMDNRYDLLRQAGVRKITEYNDKFVHRHLNPENGHRFLPYIVLVIDEFADLIMTAGKEVEQPICRLAQLARAVGIHLIIATQRPTTNIITGTIKANFPARIAFKVTSGIDSRTILDAGGAQRLIGRGDMLISLSGADLVRIQCALIETEEIERLAEFIGEQRGYPQGFLLPEYLDENEEPNKDFDPKQKDEFFNDAARLVVASQFGSTSLLQRKLQLGYNRAGRIIDQLEAAGIVGPYNGSKAREVLVHDEVQLEELLREL